MSDTTSAPPPSTTTEQPPPLAVDPQQLSSAATDVAMADAAMATATEAAEETHGTTAALLGHHHLFPGDGSSVEAAMASLAPSFPSVAPAATATTTTAIKHKTRSTNLTHEQKRLICLYAKQNPTATQAQLGKWAKDHFGLTAVPSQSSISHTLKKRHTFEHMKSEDWSSKRMRTVKHPELDTALANWFLYCQARQIRIQGDEIKAKAQTFFELMHLDSAAAAVVDAPQFSNGWLHSFQSRHGFSRSPNAHTSDDELITTKEEFVEAIKGVAPWDVFWMDETKLMYAHNPDQLEVGSMAAVEKQMAIAFCCNADGSDLMDPFFICDGGPLDVDMEGGAAVEYGFTYAYNKKTWMTPTLFREWMLALDWKMHEENRHVVLLLDSFSSHQVKKMVLKNVSVRFVTPQAASPSSGMESSSSMSSFSLVAVGRTIFDGVKRRYRQQYLDAVLDRKEAQQKTTTATVVDVFDVEVLDAIQWVLRAWRELPKALVATAFTQLGVVNEIIPADASAAAAGVSSDQTEEKLEAQLATLLKRLKLKTEISVGDFVSLPSEIIVDEEFNDQDFVDCAMGASLSASVSGRNMEPPRKMARRSKKPFSSASAFNGGRGVAVSASASAGTGPPARTGIQRVTMSADDLGPTTMPEEEWQAWADSQRFRIDEVHALETVIRLSGEMKCEPSTLLDLNRMYGELLNKNQPGDRGVNHSLNVTPADMNSLAPGAATADGKQPGGVCRFNFGGGSTTI